MSPRPIFLGGKHGNTVRVAVGENHGAACYWVYYRLPDRRRTARPFPFDAAGKAEAIAFAQGVVEEQSKPAVVQPPKKTVAEIWSAFLGNRERGWRPNTSRIYREAWQPFENFVGPHTIAQDVGHASMDALASALDAQQYAVNTIQKTMSVVRQVYTYALGADLIEKNKVSSYRYRVAKEKRPVSPDEFSMEEFGQLLEHLPIDRAGCWRAHCALGICGYQGARQHAVLHLQWRDIDWRAGEIIWRSAWDKNGVEWSQPLREPTRLLLEVARDWHRHAGIDSRWVFPAPRSKNPDGVYTIQTLWWNLKAAEKRAGIEHRRRRGGHGLRRLLAGEVHALTGSVKDAMDAIGDRDIKQAMRYLKKRDSRMKTAFAGLDQQLSSNRQANAPMAGASVGATGESLGLTKAPEEGLEPPTRRFSPSPNSPNPPEISTSGSNSVVPEPALPPKSGRNCQSSDKRRDAE